VRGDVERDTHTCDGPWHFNEPREMRVAAIDHVPGLLVTLQNAAVKLTNEIAAKRVVV
jgi:hypothetical protein